MNPSPRFQLPLSGSQNMLLPSYRCYRFPLSTPSLGITCRQPLGHFLRRHASRAFNSLSRDHLCHVARQEDFLALVLSTPSLGITTEKFAVVVV